MRTCKAPQKLQGPGGACITALLRLRVPYTRSLQELLLNTDGLHVVHRSVTPWSQVK